jgi:hypothetical protein
MLPKALMRNDFFVLYNKVSEVLSGDQFKDFALW